MERRTAPLTICNTCTKHLVELCCRKSLFFRLFRMPLISGMRIMSYFHGIDLDDYPVRTERCKNCVRFMKNALKERSPVFARLNDRINPYFNQYRDRLVSEDDKARAKSLAAEFMEYECD
jgi:hypothetical protein